jgi:hypothetical protein
MSRGHLCGSMRLVAEGRTVPCCHASPTTRAWRSAGFDHARVRKGRSQDHRISTVATDWQSAPTALHGLHRSRRQDH